MRTDKGTILVHRYAWERVRGKIPDSMEVDHICWHPACVNVDHLRLASRAQNVSNRNGAQANNRHTGIRDVYPNHHRFQVRLTRNGERRYFGTYSTIEEAAEVAERARYELFGEYGGRGGRNGRSTARREGARSTPASLAVH